MNPSWARLSTDHRLQRIAPYENVGVELQDVHLGPDESVVVLPEIITIDDDDEDDDPVVIAEIITISDDSSDDSSGDDSTSDDSDDDSRDSMDQDNADEQDDNNDDGGLYANHHLNPEEMADAYGPFRGCPSPLPGREPDVSRFMLGFQLL